MSQELCQNFKEINQGLLLMGKCLLSTKDENCLGYREFCTRPESYTPRLTLHLFLQEVFGR